jgi:hypothetical protein
MWNRRKEKKGADVGAALDKKVEVMYDSCGETTILGTLYGAMERRTD